VRHPLRFALVAVLLCAPLTLPVAALARRPALRKFDSCQSLLTYARHYARRAAPRYRRWDTGIRTPESVEYQTVLPMSAPAGDSEGQADGGGGTSTTNVQEAGIDEPDIVKTHGSVVLAVSDSTLHAVDARSPLPRRLGSVELEGEDPQLLVHGDRALVITSTYAEEPNDRDGTLLSDVDVSNPRAMRVVRTQVVDGDFVSARMAGATARVVISTPPRALEEGDVGMRRQLRGWMPTSYVLDRRTGEQTSRPVTRCRSVNRTARFSGLEMTTVLTIDLERGLPAIDADAILSDADTVYESPDNLYVATQRWGADGYIGPTAIHKFSASGPDTAYRSSGEVAGSVPSQWALSEREGVLRVASIVSDPDGEQSESYITTLGERDGRLHRLGRVDGLGQGEDLYAVRFIGDVGYVVTFLRTDPLYTVDLSDPEHPRVAGQLKISGYSAYLHPIGDDLLLGVGQDATARGETLGTQLSVFDVSDPAHPRRLHRRRLPFGDSWSEAEDDHHAFLYWAPKDLAVLPIESDSFNGAVGYRVRRDEVIQEAGRTREDWVRRSLVVDGRLVTVSDEGVAIHDLDTLARRGAARFPS
jgi:uncharacterized secreted protein with C-terminal beta-propeller domain